MDVRYFKVKWTPVPVVAEDQELGVVEEFEYTLGCDEFNASVDWATFVQKILSKVNDGAGLSYNDFVNTYSSINAKVERDYTIDTDHNDYFKISWDNAGTVTSTQQRSHGICVLVSSEVSLTART